jgi:L-amino acid N-acyltransferase
MAAGTAALAKCPAHMGDAIEIRDAHEDDLPGLLAIYNDVIATSTAVYAELPVTLEERRQWWRARTAQAYPVLIAADAHGVAGFATFGDFRTWPGYRFTVEHSVHVRAGGRGHRIGTRLMQALVPRAAALGKHVMIAGVDAANPASIRFHERLGFERCGQLREVGFKFGRWLDLVFLQRRL